MPIKQVTCSVCGETVNKAQTYFVGNGHACKKHEGVQEQRDERHAAATLKTLAARDALEAKYRSFMHRQERVEEPLKPSCFICRTKGLRQQEFFFKCLMAMRKLEAMTGGPVNPFTLKTPLVTEPCIFVVPAQKVPPELARKIHPHAQIAVQMMGFVALCAQCGKDIELLPPVEWEQLKAAGIVLEIVKPALDELAKKELTRDN